MASLIFQRRISEFRRCKVPSPLHAAGAMFLTLREARRWYLFIKSRLFLFTHRLCSPAMWCIHAPPVPGHIMGIIFRFCLTSRWLARDSQNALPSRFRVGRCPRGVCSMGAHGVARGGPNDQTSWARKNGRRNIGNIMEIIMGNIMGSVFPVWVLL